MFPSMENFVSILLERKDPYSEAPRLRAETPA
jgi:hypothetical protein